MKVKTYIITCISASRIGRTAIPERYCFLIPSKQTLSFSSVSSWYFCRHTDRQLSVSESVLCPLRLTIISIRVSHVSFETDNYQYQSQSRVLWDWQLSVSESVLCPLSLTIISIRVSHVSFEIDNYQYQSQSRVLWDWQLSVSESVTCPLSLTINSIRVSHVSFEPEYTTTVKSKEKRIKYQWIKCIYT